MTEAPTSPCMQRWQDVLKFITSTSRCAENWPCVDVINQSISLYFFNCQSALTPACEDRGSTVEFLDRRFRHMKSVTERREHAREQARTSGDFINVMSYLMWAWMTCNHRNILEFPVNWQLWVNITYCIVMITRVWWVYCNVWCECQ